MPTRLNDGSANAPRMRPTHAMWALIGLPRGAPEWTLDEKFRRVAEAGFEAVECWPSRDNAYEVKDTLARHNLALGYGFRATDIETLRTEVAYARRLGAQYMDFHAGSPYWSMDEMAAFSSDVMRLSKDEGFPIVIETHRGTLTEDLTRVWMLIDRVPDIRFCIDISHYTVGSEYSAMDMEKLRPVLERAATIHARVGNGQQVQIDVGDGTSGPARDFVQFWTEAMRNWRSTAVAGDILPFVSELGPPTYAITDLNGEEISDRWEQSLVMKSLGLEAWNESLKSK